jgi:hypothetical protein
VSPPTPPPTLPGGGPPEGAELDSMLAVGRMRAALQAALEALGRGDVAGVEAVLIEALSDAG